MLDVDVSFGGTTEQWMRMAEILGTSSGQLEVDGMARHVPPFVRRERSDPFDLREARRLDALATCPLAYALARRQGWDPAAIMVLAEVECEALVRRWPWGRHTGAEARDDHAEIDVAIAPGLLWQSTRPTIAPTISVHPQAAGLPASVLNAYAARDGRRALRNLVSHPELDRHDIEVEAAEAVDTAGGDVWILWLANAPARVALEEAAARHA